MTDALDLTRQYVGQRITAVDEHDGHLVFTVRPIGKRTERHFAVCIVADSLSAYNVRAGSRILTEIEWAKVRTLATVPASAAHGGDDAARALPAVGLTATPIAVNGRRRPHTSPAEFDPTPKGAA